MDVGILLLRLTVGLTLAAHGGQKLFGWFGSGGLDRVGDGMEALGFHPGRRHALAAGVVEMTGGALLAAGFLTPLGAALAVSVMLVAAVAVHVKNGFFIMTGGYEFNLVLGVAALTMAFTGPGALSLDADKDAPPLTIKCLGARQKYMDAPADAATTAGCAEAQPKPIDTTDNANSVVLLIEYAGKRMLLTGDLESPGLELVMQQPVEPIDVLLVPHHGSSRSNPHGFAQWAKPKQVIISGSVRDHSAMVRAAYETSGAQVFHTASSGATTFYLSATECRAETFR